MSWNKCTDNKLPEVGMLIMCRESIREGEFVYYGAEVIKSTYNIPLINVGDDRDIYFGPFPSQDLEYIEWKEVEKD